MADIFGRTVNYGGSYAVDQTVLKFSSGVPNDLVAQQFNADYQQRVNRFYDLTSNKVFFIGGRTEGQLSMSRLIGPGKSTVNFYRNYGNLCEMSGKELSFSLNGQLCNAGGGGESIEYIVGNPLITRIGVSTTTEQMIASDQVTATFTAMRFGGQ
jgi:hypothetical protein